MAEHKGDYLKQHIWNIIQCVIGLGCLAFEWMAYRNTRPGSSVTAALPAGTTMTQNYSIPWYLWAGITALILSVIIPAAIGLFRKRKTVHAPLNVPSRLKIISAYYGVDGGPDSDVADKYLRPRIVGDALAGWVGADLFGAFDPAIGIYKRLKVRYSFEGREAIIERNESQLLVIPEDTYLKHLAEAGHKLCIQFPNEGQKMDYEAVWRRGSQSIELFLPLQMEAFQLSRELRLLVRNAGNKPRLDPNDYPHSAEGTAAYSNEWDNTAGLWVGKLTHRYALDYGPRVKQLVHKFGIEGLSDEGLEIHAESVNSEMGIVYVARALTDLALKMDFIRLLQDEEKK
jgi:hypothetical protein